MRIYVTGHCFPCRGKKSNLNLITMEADIRTTDYKQYLLQQIELRANGECKSHNFSGGETD